MLPPDLQDWWQADHLVYAVGELVDTLDSIAFTAPFAQQGSGNLPYALANLVPDSTKVRTKDSKRNAMSYSRM